MEIIKKYFTTGLCGTCYRELPAHIEYRSDGAAYITKTCPEHGYEEAMVERDYKFWDSCVQKSPNATYDNYNNVTVIEVTDRCNVRCKHCYFIPDNKIGDKSLEWILKKVDTAPTNDICLSGGEPTIRDDLPIIIREIQNLKFRGEENRICSVYTNGIRLQNEQYLNSLKNAGLKWINMSIHHQDYHNEKVWKNVNKTLINLINSDLNFGQLSFTVESKEQVEKVIDKILWLLEHNVKPKDFCIRSPAEIGVPYVNNGEIFASDIVKWISEIAQKKNIKFEKHPNYGSNPYHVGHILDGRQNLQIIHWATVKTVDTSYMYMGPYAMFMPNTFSTFLIQSILRDGLRKGWYQGHRVMTGPETRIDFNLNKKDFK